MLTKLLAASFLVLTGYYNSLKTIRLVNDDFRCISIYREFPLIDEYGTILRYDPYETRIFYYGDQVMYQTYWYHTITNTEEELENPLFKYEYYSFTYSAGKEYGVICDSTDILNSRIVPVDSMLQKEWAANIDFIYLFKDAAAKLLLSKTLPSGDKEETYLFESKTEIGLSGSYSLRFSQERFQDVPYSFSKTIDSMHGMKLISVLIKTNPREFPGYDSFHLQSSEIPYRLEECTLPDRKSIVRLFENEKQIIQ